MRLSHGEIHGFFFSHLKFSRVIPDEAVASERYMDYREIIRSAASRKLLDLGKSFLDILDELRQEDAAKVSKIDAMDKDGALEPLRPFLYLLDETKVKILRKRVLDEMNALIRELEK